MNFEDEMQSALATFVVESAELVQAMETGLLGIEQESDPAETINAVFRAAHTVKGSAGLFGLEHIVRFTHVLESVLDRLRYGEIAVSSALIGALLPCCDHLSEMMSGVAAGDTTESAQVAERGAELLAGLAGYLNPAGPQSAAAPDAAGSAPGGAAAAADRQRLVHLSLGFGPESLRNGMDPLSFLSYLSTVGEVVALSTLADALPEREEFDPQACYLDFEVTLRTAATLDVVREVFDFVRDDGRIVVLEHGADAAEYVELVRGAGELGPRIQQVLEETGALDSVDAGQPAVQAAQPAGPAAVVPQQSRGEVPAAAERRTTPERRAGNAGGSAPVKEGGSIRIDASRLDRLIDGVGELVIAGASAELRASHNHDEALLAALSEVMRLVEEVRDGALQLRMVPIGSTFSRFQRVVRDVGADLGKDVHLVITGGDTEVDKALVEQIGDPLMHLVRNSLDHGIEETQTRIDAGKPARGTLRLNAFHDSGSIVIEVSDDGGGIDTARVLAKAVERGMIEPGTALSEQEVCALVFEPGFSTKDAVSDLSGRGVGMDVVKRNITALRGTIDIDNRAGVGCTIRVRPAADAGHHRRLPGQCRRCSLRGPRWTG